MNDLKKEQFSKFLKEAFLSESEHELARDLWPKMHRRLLDGPSLRVPWFDWVLAAVTVAICFLIPEIFAGLLFHL